MESKQEFVKDWTIIQTLGEGAYGEVKLLVHSISGEAVAVKIIDLIKHADAAECVRKEVCIHKILHNPHIIKFFGRRQEPNVEYLFMEYAAGGELFNKIEPDVGMSSHEAQKYLKQLLSGLEYLHEKGIAHRDIKPENILLDHRNDLKLSDFGMATIFRLKGKERLLDKKCGTLPYIAPEVMKRPYKAEPADIWSCGIVFVAMLSGELPWDYPTADCPEYLKWRDDSYMLETPWCKLDNLALGLARKILYPTPQRRPTIVEIMKNRWMLANFKPPDIDDVDGTERSAKRLCLDRSYIDTNILVALSQPVSCGVGGAPTTSENVAALLKSREEKLCFSQPTQNDDLILGSQLELTQSVLTQDNFHRLVKRMTRFFVKTGCEKTVEILCSKLEKLGYTWHSDPSGVLTISTVDGRKMQLVFKANLVDMDGKLLVDFRLSKGCGIEFKRRFIQIKSHLSDIVTA